MTSKIARPPKPSDVSWIVRILFLLSFIFATSQIPRPKTSGFAFPNPSETESLQKKALALDRSFTVVELPSLSQTVHSPTITELNTKNNKASEIVVAWFGGSREGSADVNIYLSKASTGQINPETWIQPKSILTRALVEQAFGQRNLKLGNPLLQTTPEGSLLLFFVTTSYGGWSCSHINLTYSEDHGESWSPPRRIITSPFADFSTLVRNSGTWLKDGSLGLPVYHEFLNKHAEWLRIGKDFRVLTKSRIPSSQPALQPSVVPLTEDLAVGALRDAGSDQKIQWAFTNDKGQTWQRGAARQVPNPDSAAAMIRLSDGSLLLAANPTPKHRHILKLLRSYDRGESWSAIKTIEESNDPNIEFSYPALIQDSRGTIHLVYSYLRKSIRHATFTMRWLNENTEDKVPSP